MNHILVAGFHRASPSTTHNKINVSRINLLFIIILIYNLMSIFSVKINLLPLVIKYIKPKNNPNTINK